MRRLRTIRPDRCQLDRVPLRATMPFHPSVTDLTGWRSYFDIFNTGNGVFLRFADDRDSTLWHGFIPPRSSSGTRYGNFDIFWDHFSRMHVSALCHHARAV